MLPFSEFMSQSLYGENGYYTDSSKVSKAGDFYTSVSVSKFFGGAIASYILSLLESNALSLPLRIVEIGADKGYLLGDIALFLDALSEVLPQCEFIIIEPLPSLANAQKAYLRGLKFSCVLDFKIVESFEALSQNKDSSLFIISNELFDSFPCDVLDSGKMLCVSQDLKWDSKWCGIWQNLSAKNLSALLPRQSLEILDKLKCNPLEFCGVSQDLKWDSKWCGIWQNLSAKNLSALLPRQSLEILDKLKCNPLEFCGVLPQWQDFICNLSRFAKAHKNSHFVSFDYGRENLSQTQNPNAKYYNPLHNNPRFYKSHQVLSLKDFLEQDGDFHTLYQNADITYDVDFTLLDSLLCENGFQKIFCDTQAKVLIEEQDGDFHTLYQNADITYDVDFTLLDSLLCENGFQKIFCDTQAKVLIEKMQILFHTLYQNADITYDVDFTLLDSLLCENGFQKIFCDTQAKVLIEKMQILELLQTFSQQCGYNTYLKEIHKLKTLLHTLGERFLGICYTFSK